MHYNSGAIGVVLFDVDVNVEVEEVGEIRCMWYFLKTNDIGLIVYVMENDCFQFVGFVCSDMCGKC